MYAQRTTAIAFVACWLAAVLLTWGLHRQWWTIRAVRRAAWIVPLIVLACVGLWIVSARNDAYIPTNIFAVLSGFGVTAALGLVVMLPFSGIALSLERLVRWLARRRRSDAAASVGEAPATAGHVPTTVGPVLTTVGRVPTTVGHVPTTADRVPTTVRNVPTGSQPDLRRRAFITTAAAAMPAVAIAAASAGVAQSYGGTRFPNVDLVYRNLPRELDGLRILHLSDVHLGYFVNLDDLERTMIGAEAQRPDMVLVTGDLSDDLDVLPDALRMIGSLKTRLGTYASIGNHEYYRGIEEVLRSFEAGPIPMMIDTATTIAVGSSSIYLAGADDPARIGRFNDPAFLRGAVERAIDGMPSNAFTVLMSHRPEGFDIAAMHGVDLTLSGHYHGGIQLGLRGRAIIQGYAPEKYYWGHYRKGESQLYTSGGVGHWFPFRLNCPPEAPVYVLRSAQG